MIFRGILIAAILSFYPAKAKESVLCDPPVNPAVLTNDLVTGRVEGLFPSVPAAPIRISDELTLETTLFEFELKKRDWYSKHKGEALSEEVAIVGEYDLKPNDDIEDKLLVEMDLEVVR